MCLLRIFGRIQKSLRSRWALAPCNQGMTRCATRCVRCTAAALVPGFTLRSSSPPAQSSSTPAQSAPRSTAPFQRPSPARAPMLSRRAGPSGQSAGAASRGYGPAHQQRCVLVVRRAPPPASGRPKSKRFLTVFDGFRSAWRRGGCTPRRGGCTRPAQRPPRHLGLSEPSKQSTAADLASLDGNQCVAPSRCRFKKIASFARSQSKSSG